MRVTGVNADTKGCGGHDDAVSPHAACRLPQMTARIPCLASHGIREAVSYQPASHYWPLQLTETGILLVLALGLAGFCFWWLDRRLA